MEDSDKPTQTVFCVFKEWEGEERLQSIHKTLDAAKEDSVVSFFDELPIPESEKGGRIRAYYDHHFIAEIEVEPPKFS